MQLALLAGRLALLELNAWDSCMANVWPGPARTWFSVDGPPYADDWVLAALFLVHGWGEMHGRFRGTGQ